MISTDYTKLQIISSNLIKQGKQSKMPIGGYSMFPALRKGDNVFVRKVISNELQIGDIIVFSSGNKFIAHRLKKIQNNKFVTQGDSLLHADTPLSFDRIIGLVILIERKQNLFAPKRNKFLWRFGFINHFLCRISVVIMNAFLRLKQS